MTFSPTDWCRRYNANADEAERNSYMDSGWSGAVADRCTLTHSLLLMELIDVLKEVELTPADLFDRPQLAAVLSALAGIRQEAQQ